MVDAPAFTLRQRQQLRRCQELLQAATEWHGALPVLLLERCWLRLEAVPVQDLALRLRPEGSAEAPELVRWRELLDAGLADWQAQQHCWEEFGAEACHEALRRFWLAQQRGDHGWTLARYLELVSEYRRRFQKQRPRPLPLLILARADAPGSEPHRLLWLEAGAVRGDQTMRHTCA
jgi:hypothetical protein